MKRSWCLKHRDIANGRNEKTRGSEGAFRSAMIISLLYSSPVKITARERSECDNITLIINGEPKDTCQPPT